MTNQTATGRRIIAAVCAILLGCVFLVSGGWKVLDPFRTGELLEQAQVPTGLGVLGAAALGTLELFAAILLFVPRFRRWGGWLGSALMIFFICWVAYFYHRLVGQECNCFPIIKRTVGPGFFVGDGIMLLFGILAVAWSRRPTSLKVSAIVFMALVIFAGVSLTVRAVERKTVQVPNPVIVDGKPQDLTHGKVFLFFFDPECSHCLDAAKFLSKLNWQGTKVIAIPTHDPQFAPEFLQDTHFKASTSLETAKLKEAFPFVDPPYGVALVDGRVKQTFNETVFNAPSPGPALKQLDFAR